MKKYIHLILVLFLFSGISGLVLGVVNEYTKGPIAAAEANKLSKGIKNIFPDIDPQLFDDEEENKKNIVLVSDDDYKDNVKKYYIIKDVNGELLGYTFEVLAPGSYGGKLTFLVGINTSGEVVGLSYLIMGETPGLGSKVQNDEFSDQFIDITEVDDTQIDSVAGATKSSTAVKKGVQLALNYYNNILKTE